MRWYALARFRCPVCDQRLAVEHGQVRRSELVTCQNCNADLQLIPRGDTGAAPTPSRQADGSAAPFPIELAV